MKTISPLLFLFCIFLQACIIPKESRVLKRSTKEWRTGKKVLYAWADTPFSGNFLTLRGNGKFEHSSSGMIGSFEAGTWTHTHDTIRLIYVNSKLAEIKQQEVIIDRPSNRLAFEGDSTPVQMRMRIMLNEL